MQQTAPVRVLGVDRRTAVGEAFGRRLGEEPDLRFLGVLTHPDKIVEAIERLRPNLCLIDLGASAGDNGLAVLRAVRTSAPTVHTLLVGDPATAGNVVVAEAMSCDPSGFFSTEEPLDELVSAVRTVIGTGRRFTPTFEALATRSAELRTMFSKGELRVVCALARFGNKTEAAETTYYSAETVNTYVRRIRKRVAESEGRASIRLPDLIAWARDQGFHNLTVDV